MPARQDYRIRQVADRANVSERTARRWRDDGDERWKRYLDNDRPAFQGMTVPQIQTPAEPEMTGLEKIGNSDEAGKWIEPKTFTREEAVSALDDLMCYVFRLSFMLGKEPVPFEGVQDADWKALDRCWAILEKLAQKFNGGPLAHRIVPKQKCPTVDNNQGA